MKRAFILLCAGALLAGTDSSAQDVLNATGGSKTIGEASFDWSVGEVAMVNTFYAPPEKNIIVTQGLLQNELSTPVKIAGTELAQHLLVFPNPASSTVNLQYSPAATGKLSYRLMDMAGKVVSSKEVPVDMAVVREEINISQLAAANYLLEVLFKDGNNQEAVTAYKIQKLN